MTISIAEQQSKPQIPKKRKIIRKKKSTLKTQNPKEVNEVNNINKVVSLNTNTKKRKIIRKKAPAKKENKPINTESESGSGSEDDVECVFTVCWYHRNYSYLLDENTQEVFSKTDHSLVGLRYINEDELSVIDFDYANYND